MTPLVAGLFRELLKVGFVSPEEAQSSIDRYEQLQKSRPTGEQVGRYAGLGATAAVGGHLVQSAIEGNRPFSLQKGPAFSKKNTPKVLRGVAGRAAVGAITGGLMPLVRSHMDQQAEAKKIKAFLADNVEPPPTPKLGSLGEDLLEATGLSKRHNLRRTSQRLNQATAAGVLGVLSGRAHSHVMPRDAGAFEDLRRSDSERISVANPFNTEKRDYVRLPRSKQRRSQYHVNIQEASKDLPGVLAHELGHGRNHADSTALFHLQRLPTPNAVSRVALPAFAGAAASRVDNPKLRKALLHASLAQDAPSLLSEVAASARGVHMLHSAGHTGTALKSVPGLAAAFGSYVGDSAMHHLLGNTAYKTMLQQQPLGRRMRHFAQDHADELRRLGTRAGVAGAVLAPAAALAAYAVTRKDKGKTAGVGPGAPMTTSEYSGPSGGGGFNLVSDLNPKAPPSLRAVVEKKAALEGALFPKGRTPGQLLRAAKNVGTTKHDAPIGPSLDRIAGRVQPAFAKAPGVPKLKNWGLPPPGTTNPGKMLPQVRPIRIAKG